MAPNLDTSMQHVCCQNHKQGVPCTSSMDAPLHRAVSNAPFTAAGAFVLSGTAILAECTCNHKKLNKSPPAPRKTRPLTHQLWIAKRWKLWHLRQPMTRSTHLFGNHPSSYALWMWLTNKRSTRIRFHTENPQKASSDTTQCYPSCQIAANT